MKFLVILTTAITLTAPTLANNVRRLEQTSVYCDQWNKCASDQQCWNKQCVSLVCNGDVGCSTGFQCDLGKCYPVAQLPDNGRYCDQWTPCPSTQQCIGNKCSPLFCQRSTNCAVNFTCFQSKCLPTSQSGSSAGYCDSSTPCQSTHQCVNKQCMPLTCSLTPTCAPDYVCYEGSCIQINPNHTRGRYCDAENQCDVLHKCEENQCKWK